MHENDGAVFGGCVRAVPVAEVGGRGFVAREEGQGPEGERAEELVARLSVEAEAEAEQRHGCYEVDGSD